MAAPATIFIVDDDDAVRDSLKLLLETAGFSVMAFPTGMAFLETVAPTAQGCVLMDVRMPGMGGLEVHQELRRRNSALPVIVITGHGDVPLAVRAMKAGAADFIEKPFTDETILGGIRRALELGQESRQEQAANAEILARADRLTPREREVFNELVAGHPNKVIAYNLAISPRTVEIHRARVMEKMQARNLSALVRMALRTGLLTDATG
jgi:two-component system, LuxR family, response regulator FixJ